MALMTNERVRTVLLVDDNPEFVATLERHLRGEFSVLTAASINEAKVLARKQPDAAVVDVRLSETADSDRGGLELLSWIRTECPQTPVIILTALDDVAVAVTAMKLGATDFLVKTAMDITSLKKAITQAVERCHLQRMTENLERRLDKFEDSELLGQHPQILEVRRLIDYIAADAKYDVLIRGKPGTGKELVAHAIHKKGVRRHQPFVAVLAAGLPKDLLPRELFGNEPDAFTGAARKRQIGLLEEARGGVIFLDEIGELSLEVQVVLLRVLENREFIRLGGTKPVPIDCQIIAATNRDLETALREGIFRPDLYYRLKKIEIRLPKLADRVSDIPLLVDHFLDTFRREGRTSIRSITEEAIDALKTYAWPGNVRELRNCIERAMLNTHMNGEDVITREYLPAEVVMPLLMSASADFGNEHIEVPQSGIDIHRELAKLEVAYIEAALKETGGRTTAAWKLLGYNDRYTIRRRLAAIKRDYPDLVTQGRLSWVKRSIL
jgi:two-component system, NtrC family, response regulator AtoC